MRGKQVLSNTCPTPQACGQSPPAGHFLFCFLVNICVTDQYPQSPVVHYAHSEDQSLAFYRSFIFCKTTCRLFPNSLFST